MDSRNREEILALIALIDDPDPEVFAIVSSKLSELDIEAVPLLEAEWEKHTDAEIQTRLENTIHGIQFAETQKRLRNWFLTGARDILAGSMIVARYQYPHLKESDVSENIEAIAQQISKVISPNLSPMEKVKAINHVLYDLHGFRGNKHNYHSPLNSYLNEVLDTKRGNPLTLSIIYSRIAQLLKLPIFGVNLPEHFILAYLDEYKYGLHGLNAPVLFYINAFNRGAIFRNIEIELFIRQMKLDPQEEYFRPCSHEQILLRMLHNLELAYHKMGDETKSEEIRKLKQQIL